MTKDFTNLYHQIGRLLEVAPPFDTADACVTAEAMQWLGRAQVAVASVNGSTSRDALSLRLAVDRMRTGAWRDGSTEVFQILYRALAQCEQLVPASMVGAFLPVGSSFDSFNVLSKIFAVAKHDVLVVDPYLDHTFLSDFASLLSKTVRLRLLTDSYYLKGSLVPSHKKWMEQHGSSRPIELRLASPRSLHDRAIIVDGREAWTLTQSFKDLAKRSPAEIVRADAIAALKIDAYNCVWDLASPPSLTE